MDLPCLVTDEEESSVSIGVVVVVVGVGESFSLGLGCTGFFGRHLNGVERTDEEWRMQGLRGREIWWISRAQERRRRRGLGLGEVGGE